MISTALRTGVPLPQITPCPLLDRFIIYHHGLNVMRHEDDDDYGLPRTMSMDVLEDEQYMSAALWTSFSR
jgi:Aromatic acid exporter family member 2